MTRKIILSIGAAALMAGMLVAQGPGDGTRFKGKGPRAKGEMPPPGMMGGPGGLLDGPNAERRLTNVLGLNAEQQNKVHTAIEEQKVQAKGLGERGAELRTQLGAAVKAGDEGKIDQVTADLARLQQQQMAIQAKTMAKVYGALDADQKARIDRSLDRQMGVRNRRAKGAPVAPGAPPAPGTVQ
jgi:Spy/CpxP family protein refolding chaperone